MSDSTNHQNNALRIVLDTNVLISALCIPGSVPQNVFHAVGENHLLLFSDTLMDEIETVLLRDKFDRYLSRKKRLEALLELDTIAHYVRVTSVLIDSPDVTDNAILALAVDGQADYLITGNTRHFATKTIQEKYPHLAICTPREFYNTFLSGS